MNVNIWGPSMWTLLQNTAFILDEKNQENTVIYENLRILLPCIYCRESFKKFIYPTEKSTWLPTKHNYAKWVYQLHSKVNKKLNLQQIDKTVELAPMGFAYLLKNFLYAIATNNMNILFKEPTFEVVQKRYIVSKEEPFRKIDVEIVLLTLVMYGATINNPFEYETWNTAFAQWISAMYDVSKHPSFEKVMHANKKMSVHELVEYIKTMKYQDFQEKDECAKLIKAGACVQNTCQ